jgi:hypothetical protein
MFQIRKAELRLGYMFRKNPILVRRLARMSAPQHVSS